MSGFAEYAATADGAALFDELAPIAAAEAERLLGTAFHEAAHAVIARVEGIEVESLSIKPGPGYYGTVQFKGDHAADAATTRSWLRATLAGDEAAALRARRRDETGLSLARSRASALVSALLIDPSARAEDMLNAAGSSCEDDDWRVTHHAEMLWPQLDAEARSAEIAIERKRVRVLLADNWSDVQTVVLCLLACETMSGEELERVLPAQPLSERAA